MSVKTSRIAANAISRWLPNASCGVFEHDLDAKHDDGGHWLGGIFLRLSRGGLIVEVGSVRSCRPIRHRGKLTLWGIGQREAVERRQRDVRWMLDALTTNGAGSTDTTAEPALNSTTQPTNGVNDHGKAD